MTIRPDPHLFDALTHNPERRADLEARMLTERLDEIRAKAVAFNAMGEAATIPSAVVDDLCERHIRATRAYWSAEGRCASAFIVGPANFPTHTNRKRLDSADRRRQEVQDHLRAALRRLQRIALPHGMGDAIRSADPEAIAKIEAQIEAVRARHTMGKLCNALARKGDWEGVAARLGQRAAAAAKRNVEEWRTAPFHLSNRLAEIKRLEDRLAVLKAVKARGNSERQVGDVTVVENAEAFRIQLLFPGKPDEKTRGFLKANGFRWAPSEGAWQRHLNSAGRYAAERVLSALAANEGTAA